MVDRPTGGPRTTDYINWSDEASPKWISVNWTASGSVSFVSFSLVSSGLFVPLGALGGTRELHCVASPSSNQLPIKKKMKQKEKEDKLGSIVEKLAKPASDSVSLCSKTGDGRIVLAGVFFLVSRLTCSWDSLFS